MSVWPRTARLIASHYTTQRLFSRRFIASRISGSMATPYQVHVVPEDSGLWEFKQDKETAEKTSELLQEDLQA